MAILGAEWAATLQAMPSEGNLMQVLSASWRPIGGQAMILRVSLATGVAGHASGGNAPASPVAAFGAGRAVGVAGDACED